MVLFVHSSFIYNFSEQVEYSENIKFLQELTLKSFQNQSFNQHIAIVFSITSLKELENKQIKSQIQEQYRTILKMLQSQESFKSNSIQFFLSIQFNVPVIEFKDSHISTLISLKQCCDFSIIYSYSNTMLTQLISKSCSHMIANVGSQEIVKRFDFIHHFNSGINHVLTNEMSEKDLILGVDIQLFNTTSSPITQSRYFSSCIQNSKLATKSNIPHLLFTIIRNREDVRNVDELVCIQKALFKAQPIQIQFQKSYLDKHFSKLFRIKKGEYIE
ncbi:MAG: hypothetical protein ACLFPL_04955 [Candidatus Nanoarchaeia archaeon]